jgi:starvation-inducible DNA-binding protein
MSAKTGSVAGKARRCSGRLHAGEQLELVDAIAERVRSLGGIALETRATRAEITRIERPPDGAEEVPMMISRLLEAHEIAITAVREAIERTELNRDWGSNDLLMGDVLRRHELQVWFLSEHLVGGQGDRPAH